MIVPCERTHLLLVQASAERFLERNTQLHNVFFIHVDVRISCSPCGLLRLESLQSVFLHSSAASRRIVTTVQRLNRDGPITQSRFSHPNLTLTGFRTDSLRFLLEQLASSVHLLREDAVHASLGPRRAS